MFTTFGTLEQLKDTKTPYAADMICDWEQQQKRRRKRKEEAQSTFGFFAVYSAHSEGTMQMALSKFLGVERKQSESIWFVVGYKVKGSSQFVTQRFISQQLKAKEYGRLILYTLMSPKLLPLFSFFLFSLLYNLASCPRCVAKDKGFKCECDQIISK